MKATKFLSLLSFFSILSLSTFAQDAIIISPGNFIRGTIQGTDYKTVGMKNDEGTLNQYQAKDIQEFQWNGETYVSKAFVSNSKTDYRFFKLIEHGNINLYTMGGKTSAKTKPKKKIQFSPSIGLGIGSGGYRGFGMGGGISFGGGRRDDDAQARPDRRALIYIASAKTPDTILEITPDGDQSEQNSNYIRTTLSEYMSDDQDLVNRLKDTKKFDAKTIISFVKAYNSVHSTQE
ncbi:hypothetical protein [Pedobacter antarcticus]|uniref:DUF4369 domain-containing protein n=2 Tax=Pedobacter antarcticus TaxID=34086 RepID=A0A081PL38_9SPHI|nr:hypothetical protein [Pedobacter antarcticus]KEQ31411.1 hypothetical protein N180_07960 [Pedobacter antarcticus 4BY]SDL44974.1 hypothetical protein SAMN04488084_101328 [Pedobacter antarcticus]SFE39694.1 hypothetical protein SAMN03003324_00342 [Pedobacter antarcticus]